MKTYPSKPFCPLSTKIEFPIIIVTVDNARVDDTVALYNAIEGKLSDNAISDVMTSAADTWYTANR